MSSLKKILASALVLAMVLSCVGCGKTTTEESTSTAENSTASESSEESSETKEVGELVTNADNVDATEITATLGSAEGGDVSHDVYAGVAGKDYTDEKVYTFRDYLGGTTGMCWSPDNWETSDDSSVLDLISTGLYTFSLNSTADGWSVSNEMATDMAEDVTADYVGQYGISEGDTGKAWKFTLNEAACWEDGTPINADTYIYSYQQLLDPLMKNRRADSLYAGDLAIYNAKNYFYAGASTYTLLGDNGYSTAAEYIADGGALEDLYIDCYEFWGAEGYVDADGNAAPEYVSVTDETVYGEDVGDPFSGSSLYNDYFAEGADYESYASDYVATMEGTEAVTWDEVGIFKVSDYEVVFVTVNPVSSPNYYVPYYFASTYLVYQPLWESCKSYFDADGNSVSADSANIASVTTTYGTDVATTMSYGPYKLTYFELDKAIKFERNENWYGYSDGNHVGQYQTDNIEYSIITEHETALLSFLNGELDNVSLQSSDMEKYGTSDYIRYTPQSYTTKLSFNTDPEKLASRGTNAEVLTSLKFREAFSLAIDRNTFATSYTSAGAAGYGLLNYMYVYDPFTGATYRDNDAAKAALCDVYGLTWGDDGDFDTLDDAYDAITGYDLSKAQELMQEAYDELVAAGVYDGTSDVSLQISVYQSDDIYVQMFNFLNDALKSACEGTDFEGKVSLTMTVDSDYYETMNSGGTDMIFSTWGGATYTPYTLLYECYCDAADGSGNQNEYGFHTENVMVTLNINGKEYTESLQDWAAWVDSSQTTITSVDGSESLANFSDYDYDTQAAIFSRLEYTWLTNYVSTPIYYRNVGSLVSQKGDYPVTEYVDTVGFGGIQFYTYNYDDTEWAAVASSLTY